MSEVNLIALSKPSVITDCNTAADLIAYTARVSNPANQSNLETAPRLLRYLIKENHWSPFEMVHMTIEIKTTRDIARQILRHRSFSFQEFSQRYAVAPGFESREVRLQDEKNRQNSVETDDRNLNEWWQMEQRKVQARAEMSYKDALAKGIAKEQARALLPEGLTQSTLYMAGSLRSWIHYCDLRRGNGTQKEHAEIADKCWEIIRVHFPDIVKALEDD
jgi:thymidylate synthase (FAD)